METFFSPSNLQFRCLHFMYCLNNSAMAPIPSFKISYTVCRLSCHPTDYVGIFLFSAWKEKREEKAAVIFRSFYFLIFWKLSRENGNDLL